jgi:hypothetical protein
MTDKPQAEPAPAVQQEPVVEVFPVAVSDCETAHAVRIKRGVQSVHVGPEYHENIEEAEWFADRVREIIAATPSTRELVDALRELVARCDGEEGVRADGSNIQTMHANALLAKYGERT